MKIVTINENDAAQRLDKFILKLMPTLPKSMLYKGLRKNNVRLNGKHFHKGEYMLKEGDVLTLYFPDEFVRVKKSSEKLPSPCVVYEDDNILVCNKPVNLPSHADDKGSHDTLIGRILYYLEEKGEYSPESENSFTPALCNRLDRNTRGLVIAAKNAKSLRILNEKIRNREIKKFYTAVCEGIFDKKEDTLSAGLTHGEKKSYVGENGDLKIQTHYRVISEKNNTSELEIELLTGRTHQIRAHMAHIGHPLSGDVKYGAKKTDKGYSLVSCRIVFDFKSDAAELNYLKGKEIRL